MLAQLFIRGLSALLLGFLPLLPSLREIVSWSHGVPYAAALLYAAAMIAALVWSRAADRRRLAALLLIAGASAYGIIALGRAPFFETWRMAEAASPARYHYVATAPLVAALCLFLARVGAWVRAARAHREPGSGGMARRHRVSLCAVATLRFSARGGSPRDDRRVERDRGADRRGARRGGVHPQSPLPLGGLAGGGGSRRLPRLGGDVRGVSSPPTSCTASASTSSSTIRRSSRRRSGANACRICWSGRSEPREPEPAPADSDAPA